MKKIRIATRKSELAMWQAQHVETLLRQQHPGLNVELVPMVTRGDIILDQPLAQIGGKALFLKELEKALLIGEADIAVHSMKDVPVEEADGLVLDVVLKRANPFDALLGREGQRLDQLPDGAVVGTSSLRRQCQLRFLRPKLQVKDLRGNVNTRVRKLQEGEYDAIILACAGLERLGMEGLISDVLKPPSWLPAATQGTIGVQCRSDDDAVHDLVAPLMDRQAMLRTRAERGVASLLQGSCQVPLAVFSILKEAEVQISAMVGEADGSRILRSDRSGPVSGLDALAEAVAADLLKQGAGEIIERLADG